MSKEAEKKPSKPATKAKAKRKSAPKKLKSDAATGPVHLKAKRFTSPVYTELNTNRKWFVVDVKDQVVGRVASAIAVLLRGKHKAQFTPFADTGDFVIAINAEKMRLTGNKWEDKIYNKYTGYMGGIRTTTPRKINEKKPSFILEHAVKGMLPKGSLGRHLLTKLKIYAGTEHPHASQKPELFPLNS